MQADQRPPGHIDDEALAAFVDGALGPEECASVELHLAGCDRCQMAFADIVRTVEGLEADPDVAISDVPLVTAPEPAPVVPAASRRWRVPRWGYAGGGLAAAAAIVLAVWWPRGERPELRELVEAVGERRPVEGRLTGGFRFGPLESPTRGAEASTDWRVLAAAGKLAEESRGTDDPRLLGALGSAHLVTRDFDAAVKYFDQAIDLAPDDVLLRTDRAAALLARGDAAGDAGAADYVRALDDAARAVMKDPRRPEAIFNKAIALERMHLEDQELETWRAYLALDDRSPWADEARKRIAEIEAAKKSRSRWEDHRDAVIAAAERGDRAVVDRAARTFAEQVRLVVEDEVLPEWGAAVLRGDRSRARLLLRRATTFAEAIDAVNGDALAYQAVQTAIRDETVAGAYVRWGEARRLYLDDRIPQASAAFEDVRGQLASHEPLAVMADLYWLIARFIALDHESAAPGFERLAGVAAERRFAWVAGSAERMLGLISSHRADPLAALDAHERSLRWYTSAGDRSGIAGARASLSESNRLLGRQHEAWRAWRRAAAALAEARSPRRSQSGYTSAAQAALRARMPGAAVAFEEEAVRAARMWGLAGPLAESLATLARVRATLGDASGVIEAVNAARSLPGTEGVRETVLRDLDVARVEQPDLSDDERRAILTRALEFWGRSDHPDRLPALYLRRAATWNGPDRVAASRNDLEQGVTRFERVLALQRPGATQTYFDQAWGLFDALVALEANDAGDPIAALRAWERGKARTLLARLEPVAEIVDPIAGLKASLDRATRVLCYSVMEDRALVWVVSPDRVEFRRLQVTPARLRRLADEQVQAASSEVWSALFEALLTPVRDTLVGATRLVVIADAPINRVAFAGLYDKRTRRFVVQDHTVTIAPGLKAFMRLTARSRNASALPARVVAIASGAAVPALDLPALPGAHREAVAVAALYSASQMPENHESLATAVRGADVLHFAGHAVANQDYPELSFLVWGVTDRGAATLTPADIRRVLSTARLRLAVLSACSTAVGMSSRSEGMLGVAQPFLERGTQSVIASLWALPDAAALGLAVAFHREYVAGATAAEALRRAQLPLISSRPTRDWAALTVIGS